MKLNDNIRHKINFYYKNTEEYDFLSKLLLNKEELNDFLRPKKPTPLTRKERKDRVLMMKIVYSLQKLAKKNEIMEIGKSEIPMNQRAFRNGSQLFNFSAEVILAVLVAFLIGAVVAIYFNLTVGLILVPVLGLSAFSFVKNYIIDQLDKKVLSFGSELIKNDKNRYL